MRLTAMAVLMVGLAPTLSYGQVSEEEARAACGPEALKFCAADVPDRTRVERCLRANITRISPDCRVVMNGAAPSKRE